MGSHCDCLYTQGPINTGPKILFSCYNKKNNNIKKKDLLSAQDLQKKKKNGDKKT